MNTGPEFDTPEWRKIRDEKLIQWVGDKEAVDFLILYGDICEKFDDLEDGDSEDRLDLGELMFQCMGELPSNPFFDKWKHVLIPIMVMGINAWQDANFLENHPKTTNDLALSYVFRYKYVEIVPIVIFLTQGWTGMREVSLEVRRFFMGNETLEEYKDDLNRDT